jgi:hypothetical protein
MAISRSNQDWTTGATVRVGFLSLTVVQCIPTPGDYAPDAYLLVNAKLDQLYKFVPHRGLERITREEANDLIALSAAIASQRAAAVIRKAMAPALA